MLVGLEKVKEMIKKVPYALKISTETKERLKHFCEQRGILQAHFVEQAVIERLDREEMLEDALRELRRRYPTITEVVYGPDDQTVQEMSEFFTDEWEEMPEAPTDPRISRLAHLDNFQPL